MPKLPPQSERAWLTEEELAQRWGVSPDTLKSRRTGRRKGPVPPVADHLSQRPIKYMIEHIEDIEKGKHRE